MGAPCPSSLKIGIGLVNVYLLAVASYEEKDVRDLCFLGTTTTITIILLLLLLLPAPSYNNVHIGWLALTEERGKASALQAGKAGKNL